MLALLTSFSILLIYVSSTIGGDNLIYAIGEYHAYDPTLFIGNVFMGEGVISPRFFADSLFAFFMKINGGNWGAVALGFIYASAFILAFSIAKLACNVIHEYSILYALCLSLLLAINGNELADFSLIRMDSISIGMALSFAILSVSYVIGEQKNFNKGYFFAGLSSLLHIHEGLYSFLIVCIFALADIISKKYINKKEHVAIIIFIGLTAGVVVPNLLTDSMQISNQQFVYIYSIFRHPHHLVPSAWGEIAILRSLFINTSLMVFRLVYLLRYNKKNVKRYLLEAGLLSVYWTGMIIIMYIFTEKFPLAFVSTMFISKSFKFVSLAALIWAVQTVADLVEYEDYIVGFCILYYTFGTHNWNHLLLLIHFILIVTLNILEYKEKKGSKLHLPTWFGAMLMVLFVVHIESGIFFQIDRAMQIRIILICVLWMVYYYQSRKDISRCILAKLTIFTISMLLLCTSIYGKIYYFNDDGQIVYETGNNFLISAMGADLANLAENFRDSTLNSENFIADPDDKNGAGWFQIVSQRNCYVIYKVIPSSKSTVNEWYDRYMETQNIFEKDIGDIINIMSKREIDYILVNKENFEKIDSSNQFSVYLKCETDSYRIYRLDNVQ